MYLAKACLLGTRLLNGQPHSLGTEPGPRAGQRESGSQTEWGSSPGLSKPQFPHLDSGRVPAPGSQGDGEHQAGGAYRRRSHNVPRAHEELAWWWLPLLLPRVFLELYEIRSPC